MSKSDSFVHMLLYTGPCIEKNQNVPNTQAPLRFIVRDESPLKDDGTPYPIAYATEVQGRALTERFSDHFRWPDGTHFGPIVVTAHEHAALLARVEVIEAQLGIVPPVYVAPVEKTTLRARVAAARSDVTGHEGEPEDGEDETDDEELDADLDEPGEPPAAELTSRGGRTRKAAV